MVLMLRWWEEEMQAMECRAAVKTNKLLIDIRMSLAGTVFLKKDIELRTLRLH